LHGHFFEYNKIVKKLFIKKDSRNDSKSVKNGLFVDKKKKEEKNTVDNVHEKPYT